MTNDHFSMFVSCSLLPIKHNSKVSLTKIEHALVVLALGFKLDRKILLYRKFHDTIT